MKHVIILFALLPQLFYADGWVRHYGRPEGQDDEGNWVEQTRDGGYVIVGRTIVGAGIYGIWLLKTDSLGDTLWTRVMAFEGHAEGYCVQETSDGGYIIAGSAPTNRPGDPYPDLCLIKTDSIGDTLWTRVLGLEGYDICFFVRETKDGGYIATGSTDRGERGTELWLLRFNSQGDTLWTRTYGLGNTQERGYCVRQTSDGGYVITGVKEFSGPSVTGDVWLLRTDTNGDTLWTRAYERQGIDVGQCVQETSDGGYVVAGTSDLDPFLHGDVWLLRTDANGDTLWTRTWGEPGNLYQDVGGSVEETSDGGFIVAATMDHNYVNSTSYAGLIKTDSNGDTLWMRKFGWGMAETAECAHETKDGGYILTGYTQSLTYGTPDVLLIKTDSLGFAGIVERPRVKPLPGWHIVSPVGEKIVLQYSNYPHGFKASVYDTSGRKVDELHLNLVSGTITWGEGFNPGVYIIREEKGTKAKVVLIR